MLRSGKASEHETTSHKTEAEDSTIARDSGHVIASRLMSRRQFLVFSGISAALALGTFSSARAGEAQAVKVGFMLPDRGPTADEAKSLMAGFEFFLTEVGRDKPSIEVVKKDPGPNDEKILECLTELLANQAVNFLVGPLSLKASEQAIHGVGGANAVLFVVNPAIRLVSGEMCLQSSFRISANTYQCSQPLGPWAVKNLGTKAFITGDDDASGNEQADFFAHGFEKAGGTFVDRVMADAPGIKGVINAISKSDATVVFAAFKGETAGTFLKEFRKFSPALTQHLVGPGSLTGFPQTIAGLKNAASRVKTLSNLKNPVELVNNIKQKMRTEVSDAVKAAEGYDIAAIICQAVRTGPEAISDTAKMIKTIEGIEIVGPRGKISFDKNHEPILDVMVQEWEAAGSSFNSKILENLGPCRTPDFGCGRIGFPRKPDSEIRDDESFLDQGDN